MTATSMRASKGGDDGSSSFGASCKNNGPLRAVASPSRLIPSHFPRAARRRSSLSAAVAAVEEVSVVGAGCALHSLLVRG